MRALIQRVSSARVIIEGEVAGEIGKGLCVFLGVAPEDGEDEVKWIAEKTANLRIFEDGSGKMNLSLLETGGSMLVVSQFTLYGDCRRGRRPSFAGACEPVRANDLYEKFKSEVSKLGVRVESGRFQAYMLVDIRNDGPVTLLVDTDGGQR
ncbi:MAG TPA: D-tyrosyl-tRNA(Tyr) deacylase [Synergistetes bacterium]|nr:D-tyrosyl-tRNA(Tyr) deacylase [Synergistota bacterium]